MKEIKDHGQRSPSKIYMCAYIYMQEHVCMHIYYILIKKKKSLNPLVKH